jgi:hypothetical protein
MPRQSRNRIASPSPACTSSGARPTAPSTSPDCTLRRRWSARLRSIISTALICTICLARGISLRVPAAPRGSLALVGILFMTANNVLLIWGENQGRLRLRLAGHRHDPHPGRAHRNRAARRRALNLRGWLGTLLGAVGMFALLWPSAARATRRRRRRSTAAASLGFVILVLAALAFATGSVLSRRFHFRSTPSSPPPGRSAPRVRSTSPSPPPAATSAPRTGRAPACSPSSISPPSAPSSALPPTPTCCSTCPSPRSPPTPSSTRSSPC